MTRKAPAQTPHPSVWERLSPPSKRTTPALADSSRLPRNIRHEVQRTAREVGIAIHVFKLKSGSYSGVTADDTSNLSRYRKIATEITVIHPPKGTSTATDSASLPRDVRQAAERAARKHRIAIIIFKSESGDYLGVTANDNDALADHRARYAEVETITPPNLPTTRRTKPARGTEVEPSAEETAPTEQAPVKEAPQRKARKPKSRSKRQTQGSIEIPFTQPVPELPAPPEPEAMPELPKIPARKRGRPRRSGTPHPIPMPAPIPDPTPIEPQPEEPARSVVIDSIVSPDLQRIEQANQARTLMAEVKAMMQKALNNE